MNWIKSGGGPLICVEDKLASFWLGISGSSIDNHPLDSMVSDYDRACAVTEYMGAIDLQKGNALILGDMPLETTVWQPSSNLLLIVRVFYMDPDADLSKLLTTNDGLDFSNYIESIDCEIESDRMVIFDSALPGLQKSHAHLSFEILPGAYQILTNVFEPNDRTSLLVHKFEREN